MVTDEVDDEAAVAVAAGGAAEEGAAVGRVHNITRNFAVYPIFRFYWWGPIFFYRPKLIF